MDSMSSKYGINFPNYKPTHETMEVEIPTEENAIGDGASKSTAIRQFVRSVTNFSSEYGRNSYCARQIIGEPLVYPNYQDDTNALVFRHYGPWWLRCPSAPPPIQPVSLSLRDTSDKFATRQFFEVTFQVPVYPHSIKIYETYNCGSVVRVLARPYMPKKGRSQWIELWEGETDECEHEARIFVPDLVDKSQRQFITNELRVEIDSIGLAYYAEFDAVELIGFLATEVVDELPKRGDSNTLDSNNALFEKLDEERGGGAASRANSAASMSEDGDMTDPVAHTDVTDINADCPIVLLPDDLLLNIFEQMSLTELARISTVCRRFFWVTNTIMRRWKDLDMQPHFNIVNDNFLFYNFPKFKMLEKLSLSWCGSQSAASLQRPKQSKPFERPMQMAAGANETPLEPESPPLEKTDELALTPQTFMSSLNHLGKLRVLRLSCCQFVTADIVQHIAEVLPNLEEIDLSRCDRASEGIHYLAGLTNLRRLNIYHIPTVCNLVEVFKCCTKLEHVNVGRALSKQAPSPVLIALAENCPNLQSVDAWHAQEVFDTVIQAFSKCKHLKELDLGWCQGYHSETLVEMIKSCTKLEKLFLTAARIMDNRILDALATYSPNLKQFDCLSGKNTAEGTENLLKKCQKLELLDVSFCSLISREDVVRLRSIYEHVDIKYQFT
eukprot:m.31924 g.31924  ORF g.31924 m.31924 type:complete len:668 (+) comp8361_c0_seq1:163-2166(+)